MLHIKVEERTRELEEQKKLLSTQASELYRQNQLLKQQNEKITKQKGQLIQMSKKVQELTVDKLAFFTNITHEFRTPLTFVSVALFVWLFFRFAVSIVGSSIFPYI